MEKESFYFPHDYEPTSDPKIQALIGEYGATGYGVFWRIVEMLHSSPDHKLPQKQYIILAIAKQMLVDAEQTQAIVDYCIKVCELFSEENGFFYSERVKRNFSRRKEISEKRSLAGKLGAIAKQNLANTSKEKKRKEKERKEKKKEDIKEEKKNYGTFSNVLLTDGEYKKLTEQFNGSTEEKIEAMSEGIASKGYKYSSHYAAILNWDRNEKKKNINRITKKTDPSNPASYL